jgi:hypothetical protein
MNVQEAIEVLETVRRELLARRADHVALATAAQEQLAALTQFWNRVREYQERTEQSLNLTTAKLQRLADEGIQQTDAADWWKDGPTAD